MFAEFQYDIERFSKESMTFNHHSYAIGLEAFKEDAGLAAIFKPTSTSSDPISGDTFVATMEGIDYPFFGTLFHPEKVLVMQNNANLNHSWWSV